MVGCAVDGFFLSTYCLSTITVVPQLQRSELPPTSQIYLADQAGLVSCPLTADRGNSSGLYNVITLSTTQQEDTNKGTAVHFSFCLLTVNAGLFLTKLLCVLNQVLIVVPIMRKVPILYGGFNQYYHKISLSNLSVKNGVSVVKESLAVMNLQRITI